MTLADSPDLKISPGIGAFVVFFVLAVALVLLILSMNRHMRKVQLRRREDEAREQLHQEQDRGDLEPDRGDLEPDRGDLEPDGRPGEGPPAGSSAGPDDVSGDTSAETGSSPDEASN